MINPVTVHVQLTAQPERAGALRDMLCQALVAIRQSPGCQGARLLTDAEQPDRILLVEQWASVQRHEEHVQSLVDGGLMNEVLALATAPPVSEYFTANAGSAQG